jgi:hypothetical protein
MCLYKQTNLYKDSRVVTRKQKERCFRTNKTNRMITTHEIEKPSKQKEVADIENQLKVIQKKIDAIPLSLTSKLRELIKERSHLEMKYEIYTGREYF